jgi:hypothetical protein
VTAVVGAGILGAVLYAQVGGSLSLPGTGGGSGSARASSSGGLAFVELCCADRVLNAEMKNDLLSDYSRLRGAESVALADFSLIQMFVSGSLPTMRLRQDGREIELVVQGVSEDYFRVLGLSILAGRAFSERDAQLQEQYTPAVLSTAAATMLGQPDDAVGQVFDLDGGRIQAYGIASDIANGRTPMPFVYVPLGAFAIAPDAHVWAIVRSSQRIDDLGFYRDDAEVEDISWIGGTTAPLQR